MIAKRLFGSRVVNLATSAGVPAGTADGIVFCFDTTNDDLYVGASTTWTKIVG